MLRGRRDRYHRVGFLIPFTVAAIATPIQLFVGDTAARAIADDQPAKFAAMECVYESGPDQTEYIGGICTDGEVKYGIGIPGLDSFLVGFSTDTEVTGLDQIPDDEEPEALTLLHTAFDVMVGIGTALMLLVLWFAWVWWRKRELPETVWFLRAAAVSGVAAIAALEAGWIVTEVGRQPWIVNGYMKVEDAVTDAQGLWFVFGFTFLLYAALGAAAVIALRTLSRRWREADAAAAADGAPATPYAPRPGEEGDR
jgi:cytochrome d ubiquinol oxidase subunit I